MLLGPNGAGKTTLLSLGSSVLWPQTGAVECFGLDPARLRCRREFRRRVTMMPQQTRPIPGLCAREQVAYVGWLKGLSRRAAWRASEDALELVSLGPQASTPSKHLSGGQLRRLGIAQAVVHDADLVLMDEPTAGLDPEQRGRFRGLIEQLRARTHLIVSTHQTEDILESYDVVVVLAEGRVLYVGRVDAFLALASPETAAARKAEASYSLILREGACGST